MSAPRPFRDDDAPGRIPESLIDSVLDGAVDERTRREIARALRHDPRRRQEVSETVEAIRALRRPVPCPDLTDGVLGALDRKHRFLSPAARRAVRRTRAVGVLAALIALAGVAGVQRAMPRLASIAPQPTPVSDVARAVQADAAEAAGSVRDSVRVMQAAMPGLSSSLEIPGRAHAMQPAFDPDADASMQRRVRLIGVSGGRFIIVEAEGDPRPIRPGPARFMATMSVTGRAAQDAPEPDADPLP